VNGELHATDGWVGSRTGLNTVVKKKILSPCRDSNHRSTRARMEAIEVNTRFRLENLKGRDHSEELGVDGKTKLECILLKQVGICGQDKFGSE
jgi:hypothetical protein